MVTLKEIATQFGCSVATVSKALNHMPDISPHTAEQIRAVALQMGYLPNAAARTLKTNRSHIIGLMVFLKKDSIWSHEFFSEIAESIQAVMTANGYDITPVNCYRKSSMGNYLNYCRHRGYDGIIVISGGFISDDVMQVVNSTLPLVAIEYTVPHRSAVQSDNAQGLREIVRHLHQKGHRRIAFIHGELMSITQERVSSFLSTCRELNIPVPDEYLKSASYHDFETNAQATRELMSLSTPPTCIIYPDDYSCVGGMDELRAMGYQVPEDISVTGYDGIRLAEIVRPRLTTFQQDGEAIGRNAAEMLLQAMEKPRAFVPQHLFLPGRLIIGDSVKDLSGSAAPNP